METDTDELKFTCEACGKEFDPDPDTVVETHLGGDCPCCTGGMTEAEADALVADGEAFTAEQLKSWSDYELKERDLTPEDRDKLLRGEEITTGAMTICKDCQDAMVDNQEAF